MDDGALVVTGASGAFAGRLMPEIRDRIDTRVVAIGRHRPSWLCASDVYVRADFIHAEDVRIAARSLSRRCRAAVFLAGIDSWQGVAEIEPDVARRVLEVNCLSHLVLLRELLVRDVGRLVAASSDVVGAPTAQSLVYAMSKAALEEGLRQASADAKGTGLRVLAVRLPFTSTPMREVAEGVTACATTMPLADVPGVEAAVHAIVDFLTINDPCGLPSFRVWHASGVRT